MDLVTGAMIPLLRKLGELLSDEYNLEKRVRKGVKSLLTEMEMMHVVLRKVGEMHEEKLEEQVRVWAGKVRDLSYDMDDAVDTFMVWAKEDSHELGPNNIKNKIKKFLRKTTKLFRKGKALHQISNAIQEAQDLAKELGELRQRYMLDLHTNNRGDTIDPRLKAVYKDVTELVGIVDTRDELIDMLTEGDKSTKQHLKIISIVGFGGLGKTTLARAVYDKIKGQFDCGAFVSVSQNPDMKKIFKKLLYELDKTKFATINEAIRDEGQLIDEIKMFLHEKRYLIVIDDIWSTTAWGIIKCALSCSNLCSRVITTSRIVSVSKACCLSIDDMIYNMKPLSNDDSQRLFYKRIFTQESGCPHELEQVSNDILKKCGGVPLAIITIASILASDHHVKTKDQWYDFLHSIGHGLTKDANMEEMQRILLFSYYDLPSHLKTCLLYMSMFPEDIVVWRDQVIWMWIAEGFVHRGTQETGSLYDIGETYFNDLINRNMMQPLYINDEGKADACRVHDMVLDVICSMSSEENFVTILNGTDRRTHNPHRKVRRLSFQNSMSQLTGPQVSTILMAQVRSVTFYSVIDDQIQSVSCFRVLRVLDLSSSNRWASTHEVDLGYVMKLVHLRYLGLRDTHAGELPTEIGKLQFLQTLDLRGTLDIRATRSVVPSTITRLGCLMCLYIDVRMKMPVGIGNLASIEELSGLYVDGSNEIEKEIGQLKELRVLNLRWQGRNESICDCLVLSLANLQKLQRLTVDSYGVTRFDISWDCWMPPPYLRALVFRGCTSMLPGWIHSSSLSLLSYLHISVDVVRGKDIKILGTLPALCHLRLESTEVQTQYIFNTDTYEFPCARECRFEYFTTTPSMFPGGAMPRLELLKFYARASDIGSGKLDVNMAHLSSLKRVDVVLWNEDGNPLKLEEAKAALRFAIQNTQLTIEPDDIADGRYSAASDYGFQFSTWPARPDLNGIWRIPKSDPTRGCCYKTGTGRQTVCLPEDGHMLLIAPVVIKFLNRPCT
ncbi:disease resistance protein RGA5-like [Triticum urartu]|uniref:disease resistance protein RGA5-like n=1 Tax=Triticum urartu TaxID=4572 RepID=UPI002044C1B7|nr:disease resistance protein RGA5-like [Triticum urartu]